VDVLLAAASDAELEPLRAKLVHPQTESRAAWQFWLGELDGHRVVLTRTEGDPLNAVAATTLAIRRYAPRLVVVFGGARPHDPALRPGDVVVSEKFAAFDGLVSSVRPLDAGCAPLTWYKLPHLLATSGEKETPAYFFPADAPALALAKTLAAPHGKLVGGVLGSAGQVNREADRVAWLHTEWGTSTEDGESAHVAGCAQLLGVPVVGLRVIGGGEGEAAPLVLKFLEAWK
jgi:adenosylhomocysteine nucleosidase